MLYAILAYHEEAKIASLTSEDDAALMASLLEIQAKMVEDGSLGPQVRLGATKEARTVRRQRDSARRAVRRDQGAFAGILRRRLRHA